MRRFRGLLVVGVAAIAGALPAAASAATTTFTNTTPLTVPDLDNAPQSDINVSGLPGVVTDVNVFVNGVSHGNPDDFEMLLEAPFGQTTVLMNDAGGTTAVSNLNLAFNDQAGGKIPNAGPLVSQGYQPSDYATMPGLEPFISPAPAPPYGQTLALSQGTSPNGTWTLYVDDDVFNAASGSISGGWSVSITTTDPPPATPATPATPTPKAKKCKKKKAKKRAAAAKKKCKKKKKAKK